jgi:polyhydroxyalkanoate synthesis regulator phasin
MGKKRWFRFHIDRWLNGTFGLTPNEIAAYLVVICELYDNDGFAQLNVDVMARRCGMRPSSFQKAIDELVRRGKLDVQRGFVTNRTVTEEILEREKLAQKSDKSRQKLDKKSPKKPTESTEKAEKYPHKQNTEYRNTSSSFPDPRENVEIHPSVRAAMARQAARKW